MQIIRIYRRAHRAHLYLCIRIQTCAKIAVVDESSSKYAVFSSSFTQSMVRGKCEQAWYKEKIEVADPTLSETFITYEDEKMTIREA